MEISYLFYFLVLLSFISLATTDTYSVKITTERHINVVDSRFLSFTIDPKYLFSSSEKYNSKECICMASSLAPAYLRIAGPSTSHMTFHNTTISLTDLDLAKSKFDFENSNRDLGSSDFGISTIDDSPKKVNLNRKLGVSHRQWMKFVLWSKNTGFDLVFALNNEERTSTGMWDPNTALNILTVAEKARVRDIYWELGYECKNQSIEEYLNDLETLRVIIETFPPGRTAEWKVVGGDVTGCLQADSKSDFKDYVTLSNDMMDALLLNGNSSSYELERMSENDRLKLLRLLSHSQTPLWLTESTQRRYNELERAADWLASLGYSAKNGFSVHYRELDEEEMYEPTLSFYMALLFKNLVGEKVLDIQMNPEEAVLFAHCTSLRHKPVPGAVTLFGVNMDDEPARFSLKLDKREEGGDIMQFILGHDHNGNIVVNGRTMFNEGDIRPTVKRVRPYKTLLINLPSKSFGFWVVANTRVEACHEPTDNDKTLDKAEVFNHVSSRTKRSVTDDFDDYTNIADLSYDFEDKDYIGSTNKALESRLTTINKDLDNIRHMFQSIGRRNKREVGTEKDGGKKRSRRQRLRKKDNGDSTSKGLIDVLQSSRNNIHKSIRKIGNKLGLNKSMRRHSRNLKAKPLVQLEKHSSRNINAIESPEPTIEEAIRKRRSVKNTEESIENEVDFDGQTKAKLWSVLKEIQDQLHDLSSEKMTEDSKERILVKTEVTDDGAVIKVSDTEIGLIKSTMENVVNVLEDLNKNVGRFWNAITLLE